MNPNPNPEPLSDAALARAKRWAEAWRDSVVPDGDLLNAARSLLALESRLRLAEAQLRGVHDGVAQARALLEDEGELDPNPAEAMNVLKEVMDIIIYPDEALDIIAARAAEEDTDAR